MRSAAWMLALVGCATRTVAIAPGEVVRAGPDLRRDAHAIVYALDGVQSEIHAHDRVEVYLADGNTQRLTSLTLRELVEGCDGDFKSPHCAAGHVVGDHIVVRHDRSVSSDTIAKAVGFAAIGGLSGYCIAECQDSSSVPKAFAYTAAAVVGIGLLVVLAFSAGGHD